MLHAPVGEPRRAVAPGPVAPALAPTGVARPHPAGWTAPWPGPARLSRPDEPAEREAEAVAGRAAPVTAAVRGALPALVPAGADLDGQLPSLRGRGEGLPRLARRALEAQLGVDLGGVRLHVDPGAARLARAANARALTTGRHIVLGAGAPAHDTAAGKRLLAHELTHVAQGARGAPGAAATAYRQIAEQLNYDNLAERVHEAIAGLGTDEEAVYLALQQLQRDPTAIGRLEATYLNRYRVSLEADIRDDFSGEELEYALQLLNRGTRGSAQAVEAAPDTPAGVEAGARRIRAAVEGPGTDEEAIYATLLPLNRDMRRIHNQMARYAALFGENMRERIIDEMSSTELDYALYLLGGPPIRARPEITEVTEAEAVRLFAEMAGLGFWTSSDARAPVPFHYPPDGCYARAHLMAERLTELGYASEKVFAVSTAPGGLRVRTDFAADMPAGRPAQEAPTVGWWYHVAPIIHVRDAQGEVREMVIDPSMDDQPLAIDEWTRRMRTGGLARLTTAEVQARLTPTGRFPYASNVVYTTDRDVFYPGAPFAGPAPERAAEAMEGVRGTLSSYATYASVHELAAALRPELRQPTVRVDAILANLGRADHATRFGLIALFPELVAEINRRVSDADRARIGAALSAP